MTTTFSVPFSTLPAGFGADFPPEAQALLDSGQVLAFAIEAIAPTTSFPYYTALSVALPHPKKGHLWHYDARSIITAGTRVPGLVEAVLLLNMHKDTLLNPEMLSDAWDTDAYTSSMDNTARMTLTIVRDGTTIGATYPDTTALVGAERVESTITPPPFAARFDVAEFLTIAFPLLRPLSTHTTLATFARAARVLEQWRAVHPEWGPGGTHLPLQPPTLAQIGAGIKTHELWD